MPKRPLSNDEARTKLNQLGLKYDFSLFCYNGSRDNKSVVMCPEHGVFYNSYHAVMKSHNGLICKQCRNEHQQLKIFRNTYGQDFNYYQHLINVINKNLPDHSIDIDKIDADIKYNSKSILELYCKKHHRFLIGYVGLKKGIGCPYCKNETGERSKVYYDIKSIKNLARQKQGMCLSQTYHGIDEYYWFCCKHGEVFNTTLRMILNKDVWCRCKKCKTTRRSKAEDLIADYLDNRGVRFETEKRFDDLKSDTGQPLSFDFFLPDHNTLIEYDGMQHFKPVNYFGGEITQRRIALNDKKKNKYVGDNNLNLIRISYKQKQNIIDILNSYLFETQEYSFVGFT